MDKKRGNNLKVVTIREYKEDIDTEEVKKLEKDCKSESKEGISLITNFLDDPLCRIRLYPLHVMLVAELLENGELVGVVRGCIKCVGTGFEGRDVKLGSILGLRVSPRHRRMGIGLKLVQAIEEWMTQNDAQYTFLATEEKNVASKYLFPQKCNYEKLCSLVIYAQPIYRSPFTDPSQVDVKIEKLAISQAITFYNGHLGEKYMLYPTDMDAILQEQLSLGTWLCYLKEENHDQEEEEEGNHSIFTRSSWAIFSIWNTCDAYKLQRRKTSPPPTPPHTFKLLHSTLRHARKRIFPWLNLKLSFSENDHDHPHVKQRPFGFLFLYGVYAQGERVGVLMESVWRFASSMAAKVKGCNAIMMELGVFDPMRDYVPQESSISCIEDVWYVKRVQEQQPRSNEEDDALTEIRPLRNNVFVDPRDF